ncbi:Uncharacterised protein [Mycobacteroides abscessus subsp. abscessus]|nr:Uncharacterised protein [Mycobacteroides abscessus subsp. abscessus]
MPFGHRRPVEVDAGADEVLGQDRPRDDDDEDQPRPFELRPRNPVPPRVDDALLLEPVPRDEEGDDDDGGEHEAHAQDVAPRDVGFDGDRGDECERPRDDGEVAGEAQRRRPCEPDTGEQGRIPPRLDLRQIRADAEEDDRGDRNEHG